MLTNTNNTNGNTTKKPIVVIGIDHGYGNIKTANTCFRAGVVAYEKEPIFTADALFYNGTYYGIGEDHKEFIPDKGMNHKWYHDGRKNDTTCNTKPRCNKANGINWKALP